MCLQYSKRHLKGYSLAEILISIAVIGMGLLAVTCTIPVGLSYLRVVGDRYFVVQQAQAQMEAIKSMQYADLMLMISTNSIFDCDPLYDLKDPNNPDKIYPGYRSKGTISRDPNDIEGVLHIKVEIYWNESNSYGKMSKRGIDPEKTYILDGYKSKGIK